MVSTRRKKGTAGAAEAKTKDRKTKKQEKKEEEAVAEDMELGDAPAEEEAVEAAHEEAEKEIAKKASDKKNKKNAASGGKKKSKKDEDEDAEMGDEDVDGGLSTGASVVSLKTGKAAGLAGAEEQRVVYVGRLPVGFEENELRKFFEQFGNVTAVVLGRSAKTGGSRHYGFVEFERADVAQIAAAAMNNYYLDHRRLDVSMADDHVRDLHERHIPRRGARAGKKDVDSRPMRAASRHSDKVNQALEDRISKSKTKEGSEAVKTRLIKAQARRAEKLKKAGIQGFKIPEPTRV